MKNILSKLCVVASLLAVPLITFAEEPIRFSSRTDVDQFITSMVKKDRIKRQEITDILDQVELQPSILEKIQRPYETKPWYQYRDFFMTEDRINGGVAFWRSHEKQLRQAEEQFGVPAEVIVAILGVETLYGTRAGDYRVLDALATLAFNFPPRAPFFQSELRHFLLLTREQHISPTSIKGSYAGAIGYPQFMPSSYRNFGVDFRGNNRVDLLKNSSDAISSIGNYFRAHGWEPNSPIAMRAKLTDAVDNLPVYLQKPQEKNIRFRPQWRLQTLSEHGFDIPTELNPDTKVCLIDLDERDAKQYWLGFNNLYVITRYNSSINYAMVVFDLSQQLKAAHDQQIPYRTF